MNNNQPVAVFAKIIIKDDLIKAIQSQEDAETIYKELKTY